MWWDMNDRNITPETPYIDPNGGKVENDNVDHDQEFELIASLVKENDNIFVLPNGSGLQQNVFVFLFTSL